MTVARAAPRARRSGRRGGRRRWSLLALFTDAAESAAVAGHVRRSPPSRSPRCARVRARGASAAQVDELASQRPAALASMVRRNRRRYGGYLVHVGIAVLMLGVAASSAFNTQRDVRLRPGQSSAGRPATTSATCGPTSDLSNEKLDLRRRAGRAQGRQARGAAAARRATTTRRRTRRWARSGGSSGASRPARWVCETGLARDIWTAMQPDLRVLNAPIREANRRFADASPQVQALLIAALSQRYLNRAPPATFRVIVNPMVTWIWIGGLIVLRRRADRALAVRAGRAPAGHEPLRRASRPRARRGPEASPTLDFLLVLADRGAWSRWSRSWSARRSLRAGDRRAARPQPIGWPSSRPARRPSTARSATPSSTCARASSSEADYRALDRALRREAIEILEEIDKLKRAGDGRSPPAEGQGRDLPPPTAAPGSTHCRR